MASNGKRMVKEDLIKKLENLPEGLEVVEANSTDEATETLTKLTVGDTVYSVPQGGSNTHLYMYTLRITDNVLNDYVVSGMSSYGFKSIDVYPDGSPAGDIPVCSSHNYVLSNYVDNPQQVLNDICNTLANGFKNYIESNITNTQTMYGSENTIYDIEIRANENEVQYNGVTLFTFNSETENWTYAYNPQYDSNGFDEFEFICYQLI